MDYINIDGWLKFLSSFIPTSKALLVADLIAYAVIPLCILVLLINHFKNQYKTEHEFGAWRSCGRLWLKIGAFFVIANIILYFIYSWVLTFDLQGMRSFETRFREVVLEKNRDMKDEEFIGELGGRYSSGKENKTAATSVNDSSHEAAKDSLAIPGQNETPQGATKIVTKETREYKIAAFFYYGFKWLHHALYALAWLIFACWFFMPGFTMKNQKTKISDN